MNEEIIFKAKRIDNGEWVEGYIFRLKGTDRYFIFTGEFDVTGLFPTFVRYEVMYKTICRYTGLNDKNGKKIWENDICDRKEKYREIVKYNNGDWTLDYSYASNKEYGFNYCNLGFYVCERGSVEVVGNIFDNKKFIEKIKNDITERSGC